MVGDSPDERSRASDELPVSASLELAQGVVFRDLVDRILVRQGRDGAEFEIGGSGVTIWRQVAQGTSDVQLREDLDELFAGRPSVVEESLRFVAELSERGLVVRGE